MSLLRNDIPGEGIVGLPKGDGCYVPLAVQSFCCRVREGGDILHCRSGLTSSPVAFGHSGSLDIPEGIAYSAPI